MRGFADFHTHTVYSHGRGTIADNVAAARARGLAQVGMSDHGPANLFGVGVRGPSVFLRMRAEIAALEEQWGESLATADDFPAESSGSDGTPGRWIRQVPQVFLGVEANVVDLR